MQLHTDDVMSVTEDRKRKGHKATFYAWREGRILWETGGATWLIPTTAGPNLRLPLAFRRSLASSFLEAQPWRISSTAISIFILDGLTGRVVERFTGTARTRADANDLCRLGSKGHTHCGLRKP